MQTTHRWLSIIEGCLLVALGVHLLQVSQLLISGTAGLGLVLIQVTNLSFGQLFFLLNLPFYILAWRTLGRAFTLRTFLSISLLSVLSELMARYVHLEIHPILASVLGGLLVGFGLILLFRHQASLGGMNILAVYLERRFNWHASTTLLIGDLGVLLLALLLLEPAQVIWSVLAFIALSSVVKRYHRPPAWAVPKPAAAG
ncbi:YitT family protein [Marinospirillum sp. MEB164]|uniref:YitT family protein n=1 Tax=Marinospirillum alkalitolerans TaxID=3123374 RepID=A0ABW8PUL7_9GAMM